VKRTYRPRDGSVTPAEWFWVRVKSTPEVGCWEYTQTVGGGYAQFFVEPGVKVYAHRYAYELLVGPIPEGLDLDHLCRNRRCVRPSHLEPVTRSENVRRSVPHRHRQAVAS
jgi:hypothetical protein